MASGSGSVMEGGGLLGRKGGAPRVVAQRIEAAVEYDGVGGEESPKYLPQTLVPGGEGDASREVLFAWIEEHRDEVLKMAEEHGAVLFRGFGLETPDDFAGGMDRMRLGSMPYVGGAAVRTPVVGDRIFTANESPPSEPIPFHHELAQTPDPPTHVLFFCETPAPEGGETPLVSSPAVYEYAKANHPAFVAELLEKGVRYVRVLPEEDDPSSAIGRSWKSTYGVSTREEAQVRMAEAGTSWEWLEGGNVRTTTKTLSAIRDDPRKPTRKLFFNQVLAAFTGWIDSRNDPTKAVIYGDGTPVDAAALSDVAHYATTHRAAFRWEKGDFLLVDNLTAMHSRNPFVRPRRVLAGLGRGTLPTAAITATISAAQPTFPIPHSSQSLPALGLSLRGIAPSQAAAAVINAVRTGIRLIDLGADFGNLSDALHGLSEAITAGFVHRKDVFLMARLPHSSTSPDEAISSALAPFSTFGLDALILDLSSPLTSIDTLYPAACKAAADTPFLLGIANPTPASLSTLAPFPTSPSLLLTTTPPPPMDLSPFPTPPLLCTLPPASSSPLHPPLLPSLLPMTDPAEMAARLLATLPETAQ